MSAKAGAKAEGRGLTETIVKGGGIWGSGKDLAQGNLPGIQKDDPS